MPISRRSFLSASAVAGFVWNSGHWCFASDDALPCSYNPFLQGNFAPVREEITAENLKVVGRLPRDLDGMFVRNGPNPQFPPKNNYHMFEGDGMLHGVRVRDGQASYRNRWVRTAAWKDENDAGKALYASILDPPDLKAMSRQILAGKMPYPNRGNTALLWHHGKLLALWEGGPPHQIKVPDLGTMGLETFGGRLRHAFTAHPKVDVQTGELMFLGYSPFPPFLQYSVADRGGKIVSTTSIELPRPVMMHDFAITNNYTVFLDTPGVLDLTGILTSKPLFRWEPKLGARIGILPRHAKGDLIKWFQIEPCFVFHVFNAYEDGDEVHLYACRYPEYPKSVDLNAPVLNEQFEERADSSPPLAYQWRLNMKTGQASETALDDIACEFPRVDDRLAGAKTRYGYAVSGTLRSNAFVKFDFERDTSQRHSFGKGRLTGEGVFVPRREGKREDDGYLVSFVHDQVEQRSELVVVDARDFTRPPIARVVIPQRVPFGFHGLWLTGEVL